MKADERKCPACAEAIKWDARRCKHCGHEMTAEELADGKKIITRNRKVLGCGCVLPMAIVAIMLALAYAEDEKNRPEIEAKLAEDKRKGLHCLSAWDGSSPQFVRAVKLRLRDPNSFEHIKTIINPADKVGEHLIAMDYRAKNGFGGMDAGVAMGIVSGANCDARVTSADLLG